MMEKMVEEVIIGKKDGNVCKMFCVHKRTLSVPERKVILVEATYS